MNAMLKINRCVVWMLSSLFLQLPFKAEACGTYDITTEDERRKVATAWADSLTLQNVVIGTASTHPVVKKFNNAKVVSQTRYIRRAQGFFRQNSDRTLMPFLSMGDSKVRVRGHVFEIVIAPESSQVHSFKTYHVQIKENGIVKYQARNVVDFVNSCALASDENKIREGIEANFVLFLLARYTF